MQHPRSGPCSPSTSASTSTSRLWQGAPWPCRAQRCSAQRSRGHACIRALFFRKSAASPAPPRVRVAAPGAGEQFVASTCNSIDEISAAEWDALAAHHEERDPFVSHAFLSILEKSGSVTRFEGWLPQHLVLREGEEGPIVGAVPMYLKSHSYGEYVFDGPFARFAALNGMRYYPKLQCCVPFSPVPGSRLLTATGDPERRKAILQAQRSSRYQVSSVHVTFSTAEEAEALEACGFSKRIGMQYHWENDQCASFDDFLLSLRQSKRKNIKQERKSVAAQGLRVKQLTGDALREAGPALWRRFYTFYEDTADRKWGTAYLKPEFFQLLGERMADQVLLVVAEQQDASGSWEVVAGSLNLIGSHCLYGRNWGCKPGSDFKMLHYELCYYQALDYAIEHGLKRVEAGAQGEHKLQRGYLPALTYSASYFRNPTLKAAVDTFLVRERQQVAATCAGLSLEASPFKAEKTAERVSRKLKLLAREVSGTPLEAALSSLDPSATE